jgi:hypothetical protein
MMMRLSINNVSDGGGWGEMLTVSCYQLTNLEGKVVNGQMAKFLNYLFHMIMMARPTDQCRILNTMVTGIRLGVGTDIGKGVEGGSPSALGKLRSSYIRYFVLISLA